MYIFYVERDKIAKTRYSDDVRKITEEDYLEALDITQTVYNWAKSIIEES